MISIILVSSTQVSATVFRSNENFELYTIPFNNSSEVIAPRDIAINIRARFDSI